MNRIINNCVSLRCVLAILFCLGVSFTTGCDQGGGADPDKKGTGPSPKADKKLVVGFSQIGAESSWRTAETTSIRSEAEKRGVDLKFADAQQKQENQIKSLNAFISQGVDAIILAPVVETGWEPVLKNAKRGRVSNPLLLTLRGKNVKSSNIQCSSPRA